MEHVGLMVSDGLAGLDTALSVVYPKAQLQRCVTHLKRNMLSKVRHGDKMALAEDLRDVFRTGQRDYTLDEAGRGGQDFAGVGKGLPEHKEDGR